MGKKKAKYECLLLLSRRCVVVVEVLGGRTVPIRKGYEIISFFFFFFFFFSAMLEIEVRVYIVFFEQNFSRFALKD
jgi:hypothetical protein